MQQSLHDVFFDDAVGERHGSVAEQLSVLRDGVAQQGCRQIDREMYLLIPITIRVARLKLCHPTGCSDCQDDGGTCYKGTAESLQVNCSAMWRAAHAESIGEEEAK